MKSSSKKKKNFFFFNFLPERDKRAPSATSHKKIEISKNIAQKKKNFFFLIFDPSATNALRARLHTTKLK